MKPQASKIDGFVQSLPKNICAVLIFGPDAGLVSERTDIISKQIVENLSDPFLVTELDSDKVESDGSLLLSELGAISMLGGRKLIRLRGAANGVVGACKDALAETTPSHGFLVVSAGDLPATSTLRQLFEKAENAAAIPCYVDDARGLSFHVAKELKARGMRYDSGVVELIAGSTVGNRQIFQRELDKLCLYVEGDYISEEAASQCVREATESSMDDVCSAVADGNQAALMKHVQKAFSQGAVPVMLLRSVSRYFLRLYTIQGVMEKGQHLEGAIDALRPPVFFKVKPALTRHAMRWTASPAYLPKALDLIYQAELECKKTGSADELMCSRFLMQVASLPRARKAG